MNDRFKFRYVFENKVYDAAKLDFLWEEVQVDTYDHVDTYSLALAPGSLLQCTGLKDKNGTLIYEGDIVKAALCDGRYQFNAKVIWNNDYLCFDALQFGDVIEYGDVIPFEDVIQLGDVRNPLGLCSEIEVIGNIYENPELLSVRNEE